MFPATGSTMIAAICRRFWWKTSSTASRSLYRATSVSRAAPSGTPGLEGTPKVAAPDPALMRKASPWPW